MQIGSGYGDFDEYSLSAIEVPCQFLPCGDSGERGRHLFRVGPRPQRAHAARGQLGPGGAALACRNPDISWKFRGISRSLCCRSQTGCPPSRLVCGAQDPMPVSRTDKLQQHTQELLEAGPPHGAPPPPPPHTWLHGGAFCGVHEMNSAPSAVCGRNCRTPTTASPPWSGPRYPRMLKF